jgi:CBS domain-containing protein
MAINSIYNPHVITVCPDTKLKEVARIMAAECVGCVVVVEDKLQNQKPMGIITDRDIVTKVVVAGKDIESIAAQDIMGECLVTLKEEDGINDAIRIMQQGGIRRIPVVNENGHLSGIVTADDLLVILADELNGLADMVLGQVPENSKNRECGLKKSERRGSDKDGVTRMESEGGGGTAIKSEEMREQFSRAKSPGFENRAEEIAAMDI